MASKTTCGAHDLLVENVTHLRNSIGDLYSLNRKTTDEVSEMKVQLVEVVTKLDNWHEETERQQASLAETFKDGIGRIEEMIKAKPTYATRQRWRPAHTVALLSATLGPTGIAGVVSIVNNIFTKAAK